MKLTCFCLLVVSSTLCLTDAATEDQMEALRAKLRRMFKMDVEDPKQQDEKPKDEPAVAETNQMDVRTRYYQGYQYPVPLSMGSPLGDGYNHDPEYKTAVFSAPPPSPPENGGNLITWIVNPLINLVRGFSPALADFLRTLVRIILNIVKLFFGKKEAVPEQGMFVAGPAIGSGEFNELNAVPRATYHLRQKRGLFDFLVRPPPPPPPQRYVSQTPYIPLNKENSGLGLYSPIPESESALMSWIINPLSSLLRSFSPTLADMLPTLVRFIEKAYRFFKNLFFGNKEAPPVPRSLPQTRSIPLNTETSELGSYKPRGENIEVLISRVVNFVLELLNTFIPAVAKMLPASLGGPLETVFREIMNIIAKLRHSKGVIISWPGTESETSVQLGPVPRPIDQFRRKRDLGDFLGKGTIMKAALDAMISFAPGLKQRFPELTTKLQHLNVNSLFELFTFIIDVAVKALASIVYSYSPLVSAPVKVGMIIWNVAMKLVEFAKKIWDAVRGKKARYQNNTQLVMQPSY